MQTATLASNGRTNQTSEQFQRLEGITNENDKLVAELESRLQPILRQPEVAGQTLKAMPAPSLAPLPNAIRGIGDVAERCNATIRSLLERIEV